MKWQTVIQPIVDVSCITPQFKDWSGQRKYLNGGESAKGIEIGFSRRLVGKKETSQRNM